MLSTNFWKNQDIIYDYQADVHGTGSGILIAEKK